MATRTFGAPSFTHGQNGEGQVRVYLGSAELAAVCSILGRIPTKEEYMANTGVLDGNAAEIYRYMNFDKLEEFSKVADSVQM